MKYSPEALASFYKDLSVIVTGGLGFIGSNLAIRLAEFGTRVTIVDSLMPQYGGNLFNIEPVRDRVRVNIADVRDQYSMNYLVRGHDLMFNLAGQVSHIESMNDPFTDLDINTRSQLSILQSCRMNNPGIKIVYSSTRQIYGKPQYLPVDEKHPVTPTDINGINMVAGEQYHLLYHQVYGLRTVVLRLTNTYGPRLLVKHNRQGFLGWFIRLVLDGRDITIYGDGQQLRDLNYVDDVVQALLVAGANETANGQVMNLGDEHPISLLEIARIMIEINGSGHLVLVPFPEEQKKIDIGHYYSDYSRAREILEWSPQISVEKGLSRTIAYYRRHGREHYWN